ncbi:MAG TPA: phosphoribosylpyrophosphate synthetase [Chitinophagales bacterium]
MSQETTLVSVLETLRKRGYTEDFNIVGNDILYKSGNIAHLHELVIDEVYRFEGDENDVGDAAILYALSCETHGKKGILVNGYGTASDPKAEAIINQIARKK